MVTENTEPLPGSLSRLHAATQQFGQPLAQRQAQPGAAQALLQRRLDLREVLEDGVVELGRDADAGVGHGEGHLAVARRRCAVTRTSPLGVNFSALEMKLRRICDSLRSSV